MLSRFMYSIVSETMVSGSCGLCSFAISSADLSSARSSEGGCGDSSQWNLYCVNHIVDAKLSGLHNLSNYLSLKKLRRVQKRSAEIMRMAMRNN